MFWAQVMAIRTFLNPRLERPFLPNLAGSGCRCEQGGRAKAHWTQTRKFELCASELSFNLDPFGMGVSVEECSPE
ncbi:hypothetical protein CHARACLAT_013539 [Characodon lateralis]|uniref:Uncharacterized protein n=1 Tax=Characodon lateralis TaxID=208331 RepID=A0ABU7DUG9_9TELE|nr:hypothetical protein [Characodon lateralis]